MSDLLSGYEVRKGHTAITRGILKDATVEVVSMGSQFYNTNYFPHIHFLFGFCKWLDSFETPPQVVGYKEASDIWSNYSDKVGNNNKNKIVIAETPEKVDREYLHILDGGILHEAFHSMYTHTGNRLDIPRMGKIMERTYNPNVPYVAKAKLLKTFWNILEDSFIERQGIKDFGGAHYMLNKLHLMSWEREKQAREAEIGSSYWNEELGIWCKAFTMMDHVMWYFRDRVQNYLVGAPLYDYDPAARHVVDVSMKEIVERGQNSKSTYETFELAMEAINILTRLFDAEEEEDEEEDPESQEGPSSEDSSESEDNNSQENDSQTNDSDDEDSQEGSANNEEDHEGSEGDNQSERQEGDSDAGADCAPNASEEGDGTKTQESQKSSSQGTSGASNDTSGTESNGSIEKSAGSGVGEGNYEKPEDFEALLKELSSENEANGGTTLQDLIDEKWGELSPGTDLPQTDRPLSREYDKVTYIKDGDLKEFRRMAAMVRKDTVYIRSKMAAYLRGEKKVRRTHRQERGRRLSARNVHEVVYKEKPKPFQTRTTTLTENAVVSIVMDESGSMADERDRSKYMLATFAVSFQQLNIPFEVIGFQYGWEIEYNICRDYNMEYNPEWNNFTRTHSANFNIFRTFDEPLTDKSLSKLMNTRAFGGTPLLAGYDFAARRIAQRPEPRRLIIVITDGYPTPGNTKYDLHDHINICNNESKLLEKMGIETLFVGYGMGASKIKNFDNHVHIHDLKNFSKEMNAYLMKNLRKKLF